MRLAVAIFLTLPCSNILAQDVELIKIEKLEQIIDQQKDALVVINFWSTWCVPCVKELPYFNELDSLYPQANISMVFVSLDFPENLYSKVVPLLRKKGISRPSYLLDEADPNIWMEKVNGNWGGSIPATLIIQKDRREFYEGSFTRASLREALFE